MHTFQSVFNLKKIEKKKKNLDMSPWPHCLELTKGFPLQIFMYRSKHVAITFFSFGFSFPFWTPPFRVGLGFFFLYLILLRRGFINSLSLNRMTFESTKTTWQAGDPRESALKRLNVLDPACSLAMFHYRSLPSDLCIPQQWTGFVVVMVLVFLSAFTINNRDRFQ